MIPWFQLSTCVSFRHCADAVLSLSNRKTVVGTVASVSAEFMARWVQSPSDYDYLIASTMPYSWVTAHRPVLSTHQHGHVLYSNFTFREPNGMVVVCHSNCTQPPDYHPTKNNVRFTCYECNSRCTTGKYVTDRTTTLGRKSLIKVPYPQLQYPTEWKFLTPPGVTRYPQASSHLLAMPPQVEASSSRTKTTPAPEDKAISLPKVKTKPKGKAASISKDETISVPRVRRAAILVNLPRPMAPTRHAPPDPLARTNSLPASLTSATTPSSSSLKIRLPPRPYVEILSRSRSEDHHRGTAANPPPSPSDPLPIVLRKRLPDNTISLTTRKRKKED
jgi:hypothetical protein